MEKQTSTTEVQYCCENMNEYTPPTISVFCALNNTQNSIFGGEDAGSSPSQAS